MSDQEKNSGGGGGSPAVILEQTPNSRHKAPYRPTDLQDNSDLHHKHIRAPTVQSVAEELKILTQDNTASELADDKEQKDYKRAISSEMNKQNVAKKLSSSPKKRNSSPESMILAPMEVDTKGSITPPTQPIPQDVEAISEVDFNIAEKDAAKKVDTDSITEEISEGRTAEPTKKYSNWNTKKEITWKDKACQGKEDSPLEIGAKSQAWILERRPSVGPCFRPGLPFEGPTGITIHMPRKSITTVRASGININVSRKSFTSKSKTQIKRNTKDERQENEVNERENIISALKEKIYSVHSKIKNAFHF